MRSFVTCILRQIQGDSKRDLQWGSLVVKVLGYKPEGRGFETR
jgi:hypothetical protein